MSDTPPVVAIIEARKHSQRLPGKHFMEIGRKVVIRHVIDSCLASSAVDATIISSDDPRLLDCDNGRNIFRWHRSEHLCLESPGGWRDWRRDMEEEHLQACRMHLPGFDKYTIVVLMGNSVMLRDGIIDECVHRLNHLVDDETRRLFPTDVRTAVQAHAQDHPYYAVEEQEDGFMDWSYRGGQKFHEYPDMFLLDSGPWVFDLPREEPMFKRWAIVPTRRNDVVHIHDENDIRLARALYEYERQRDHL